MLSAWYARKTIGGCLWSMKGDAEYANVKFGYYINKICNSI